MPNKKSEKQHMHGASPSTLQIIAIIAIGVIGASGHTLFPDVGQYVWMTGMVIVASFVLPKGSGEPNATKLSKLNKRPAPVDPKDLPTHPRSNEIFYLVCFGILIGSAALARIVEAFFPGYGVWSWIPIMLVLGLPILELTIRACLRQGFIIRPDSNTHV